MGMGHYDKQGNIVADLMEWARLREDDEYSRIGSTKVGHYWVSTVWLGLDHSFGSGPPLIFETMVFDQDPDSEDQDVYCDRYTTEQEALEGHAEVVAQLAAGIFRDYNGNVLDSTYVITEVPTLI